MEAIQSALNAFLDFFNLIVGFIQNVLQGFVDMFKYVVWFGPQIVLWIGNLPTVVVSFILFGVALSVVFLIVNRQS